MPNNKPHVNLYTDGACSGNPGPGGWACILVSQGFEKEMSGYNPDTTNNRMELTAALEGLKALTKACLVDLYSDSAYLVSAFNQHWLDNWKRNGWKNAAGQAVSNPDLWQALLEQTTIHQINWHKVKGHSDHPYNNRCDALAVQQIKLNRRIDSVDIGE